MPAAVLLMPCACIMPTLCSAEDTLWWTESCIFNTAIGSSSVGKQSDRNQSNMAWVPRVHSIMDGEVGVEPGAATAAEDRAAGPAQFPASAVAGTGMALTALRAGP